MNLHLVLAYRWFEDVQEGRKRIEYREIKPYWRKRIWDRRDQIKTVSFSRGYSRDTLSFEVFRIDTDECPYMGWPSKYYRIHFRSTDDSTKTKGE